MRKINLKDILLTTFLILLPVGKVIAVDAECASPQQTVLHFYHWYLNEVKNERYPLSQNYNGDKTSITKWISPSLLNELMNGKLRDEIDYDYFTYSQDFSESWLTNINAKVIKQTLSHSEVQLSLGEKDSLNQYQVELNHKSCWKIDAVKPIN